MTLFLSSGKQSLYSFLVASGVCPPSLEPEEEGAFMMIEELCYPQEQSTRAWQRGGNNHGGNR